MLNQVAEGVLVHESEFIQSNSVVVQGRAGVLLIDPGITGDEMVALANGLRELGQPVVAGFSTHPDWDHVLWHANFGDAPRYGTARCAASIRDLLSNADWKARVAEVLPPELAEEIPLDLLGLITGLSAEAAQVPWDGPKVQIIEHQAHAPGHAALLIAERGVLVAGDMLSDILMPFLDLEAADPIEDYLEALRLLGSARRPHCTGCLTRMSGKCNGSPKESRARPLNSGRGLSRPDVTSWSSAHLRQPLSG